MLSNSKHQITHLGPVEESPPNGMAILQTSLGRDGFFIFRGDNMVKICGCGCGGKVEIVKKTDSSRGLVKGTPNKFISGHSGRGRTGTRSARWKGGKCKSRIYDLTYDPLHHRAWVRGGYIFTHIVAAEKALGKELPITAEVHHHDKTQLVICQDQTYHKLLHRRMRALKACGNVHWSKCPICKSYDSIENLRKRKHENTFYHISCKAKASRENYAKKNDGNVRSWGWKRKCMFPGCETLQVSRGFCMIHYSRFKRDGTLFSKSGISQKPIDNGMLDSDTGEILVEKVNE